MFGGGLRRADRAAGIVPAPYLARAQWVALEHGRAMPAAELKATLRQAYDLIAARLPKKLRPAKHVDPLALGRALEHFLETNHAPEAVGEVG